MTQYGYDKDRFPNLTEDMFDCPICTNVVLAPKECMGCGDLFCGKCIDDWLKKQQYIFFNEGHAQRDVLIKSSQWAVKLSSSCMKLLI